MIKVALTGNIGSGKSTVAKIFSIFKIPIFNADTVARSLYLEADVKDKLKQLFSDAIFTQFGEVDKKKLASIIFNNKQALVSVNEIVHPMVINKYNTWCNHHKNSPYSIHETAILFENDLQNKFDFVINVSAPKNTRIKRVMKRDEITKELVEIRMANQLNDKIKCKLSQFVIKNDGSIFLTPQVELIHKALLTK